MFIFYAGGLTTGAVLLLGYLLYRLRRYCCNPSISRWAMGLTTILLASEHLAARYLERCYHIADIIGATSLLSPTDVMTYGWMISAEPDYP
jgi:hypothetical protein